MWGWSPVAAVRDGEVWLMGVYIPPYGPASRENHEPERPRKLLLHQREIEKSAYDAQRRIESGEDVVVGVGGRRTGVEGHQPTLVTRSPVRPAWRASSVRSSHRGAEY